MLMNELTLEDGSGFKNYCRVSTTEFEDILQKVAPFITKRDTRLREAIPAADKLAVTLRFLATGDSFSTLMYLHRMSKSTVCNVINIVTAALVKVLAGEVKLPENEEEWLHITKTFERKWNFPHCLGTLDGKHIQINAPANSGSEFYNYKGHFSIVLLAATDANYKFIYANAGVQGRISDGGVLKYTSIYDKVTRNALHIPEPQVLPGRTVPVPYAFVVDDAFPLETHFLKPYPGNYPPNSWQRIFNYRICRARRIIENAFGILSAVFRVLRTNMMLSPERAINVTLTAVHIHNYLRNRNSTFYTPPGTFDSEDSNGNVVEGEWHSEEHNLLAPLLPVTGRPNVMIDYHTEIADYFLSVDGMIPWQFNR